MNGKTEVTYGYKVSDEDEKKGNLKIKHNHEPDITSYYKAKLYEELEEIGINGLRNNASLKETVINILKKYEDSKTSLPKVKTCINFVLSVRKENVTKDLNSIVLNDYLVGKDNENKVTVYADKSAYQFFRESTILFCDGTFEKKRFGYSQIYIIIAYKDNKRVPVFYSILKGKDSKTYEKMFSIIESEVKGGMENKKFIMGDM